MALETVGRYRYLVVSVVWLTFCLAGFDRSNISVLLADPGFLGDLGLEGDPERQGLVMTAMLLPSAFANFLLGPAVDRWGARRALSLMVALWAVAALWMGSAASYTVLLVGRAARGLGEGAMFPVANRYVRLWFPASERGGANAIWNTGMRLGLAVSVPVMAACIAALGWRASFFLQASLAALLVLPAAWFLTADRPEDLARVSGQERRHIAGGRGEEKGRGGGGSADVRVLLGNYRFWLAAGYHVATLSVSYGLMTWLPKYLRDARGFDVGSMVLFATLPYLCAVATGLTMGFLSDRVGHRAAICAVGLATTSATFYVAALAPDPTLSALLIVLGFAVWGLTPPLYYAIIQRIIPAPIVGTGIGIDNGFASIGAALAPAAVGLLIGGTGSYLTGMLFLAGIGFAGSVAVAILAVQRY